MLFLVLPNFILKSFLIHPDRELKAKQNAFSPGIFFYINYLKDK